MPNVTGALGILTGAGSIKALARLVEGTPMEAGLKAFLDDYDAVPAVTREDA